VLHALQVAEAGDRGRLEAIYGRVTLSEEDVAEVLRVMDGAGTQTYCASVAAEQHAEALRWLGQAGLPAEGAEVLRKAATFVLDRDY
jgi:hypothetical protein